MVQYLIAYFIVNFIIVFKIIKNVYFTGHTEEYINDLKEDIGFFIPLTILFGTILLIIEYVYRNIEGE